MVRCEGFSGVVVTEVSGKRRVLRRLGTVTVARGVGLTDVGTLKTVGSFAIKMCGASRGGCCSGDFGNCCRVASLANAVGAVSKRCCTRLRLDTNGRGNRIFKKRLGETIMDTAYRLIVAMVSKGISEICSRRAKLGMFGF